MNTQPSITYIGVDVCKGFLDTFSPKWSKARRFSNEPKGIEKLLKALDNSPKPHLIVESTGGYERPLRIGADQASMALSMINPRQARDFAKASGRLAKTDALDAQLLANFGHTFEPQSTPLPSKKLQKLKSLVRRRFHLNDLRIRESNQLEKTHETLICKDIQSLIKNLKARIAKIEKSMITLIDSEPSLAAKRQRLEQVKGVGPIVSATLIAELPELGSLKDPQIVALCGLAPFNRDSGKHQGKRTIIGGRGRIRRTLYMPTLCAIQYNAPLKAFYQRLTDNGKPGKLAVTAAMRKLICLLNRMLTDPDFQPA